MKVFSPEESKVLEEVIFYRRDVRGNRFRKEAIPQALVEKIIWAGLHAPSVGYSQPWNFVLIKEQSIKERIKKAFEKANRKGSEAFSGDKKRQYDQMKLEGIVEAPLNIAVFYQASNAPVLGQTAMPEMGQYSVVCAIQNMWLMARSLNIGLGWVSILSPEKVKQILKAPPNCMLIGYLCLGYVDFFYEKPELQIRQWAAPKLPEEVVHNEQFNRGSGN